MSTPFKELFNQGIVTARDPSLLKPGELVQADDCIYRPNDPAIWKAPGRQVYGTVLATQITQVALLNGNALASAPVGSFGTTIIVTSTAGSARITSAASFTADMQGKRVYAAIIPDSVSVYVKTVIDTSTIDLTTAVTTGGASNFTFSDYDIGTPISGTNIQIGTTLLSIGSSSLITLSIAATGTGTVTLTFTIPIKSLLFLKFPPNKGDQLLAYAGSKLYASSYAASSGTFSVLATLLRNKGDETAEVIQSNESYLLLALGNTPQKVFFRDVNKVSTLSIRPMGMQPVRQFAAERVAGAWPISLGNNTYYFLVTECLHPDEPDEVEGTFLGDPQYVTITDYVSQAVQVYRNLIGSTTNAINTGDAGTNAATHWRVYMAPGQGLVLPTPSLASYRRVVTVSIDQASIILSADNTVTAEHSATAQDASGYTKTYSNPAGFLGGALVSVGSCTGNSGSATITTTGSFASVQPGMPVFANNIAGGAKVLSKQSATSLTLTRANIGAVSGTVIFGPADSLDGNYAFDFINIGLGGYEINGAGIRLSNFGFVNNNGYTTKPVVGVRVLINYKWDNTEGSDNAGEDRGFNVYMKVGGVATQTKVNIGHKTGQGSSSTFGGNRFGWITAGGFGDTWGRAWNTGLQDFVDGNIFLHIEKAASAQFQKHWIDAVHLQVFFSGIDVTLDGEAFPTVTQLTQVGESVSIGANGPPPLCDTGDIFEGQCILNDVSAETTLVASLPDNHEAYPTSYKINLGARRNDPIMVFRRVGSLGIVFCKSSIKRLNYFPTEVDADGTRGRAWDEIANDHGLASKQGVALFDMPGRGVIAAYVTHTGLWLTDGITCWPANDDLDWANTVSTTRLSNAVLVSYPALYSLVLYYSPPGISGANSKAIWFTYQADKIKPGGKLPAIGPVQTRARCAVRTDLAGVSKLLTGNASDGKVYLEDVADVSADTNVTITPTIRTRLIYPSDIGGQSRLERFWLRVGGHGTAASGVCTLTVQRQDIGEGLTDLAESEVFSTSTDVFSGDRLVVVHPDNVGEAFAVKITKADLPTSMRISYMGVLGEGYGLEKNRA